VICDFISFSTLDPTWIYLDKVTSRSHSGQMII
jgi:hypothetical protein